ncbi:hypothetical protein QQF64_008892 [Cirrhinus molitorella]|uniref:Prolactin receptor n=1 Tax=Cirrhinus molitorella TaxID=172907 RepID=A0ABR3M7G2_9TELE
MTNERKNTDASESIVQNGLCGNIATHSLALLPLRLSGVNALSKCQNKLLLFPDHAVGEPPTSSPWQPLVSHPKEKGEEEEKKRAFMPLTPSLPCAHT